MLTHECKGNASYKHLSIKQENIDLYYKNKPRIFATVPLFFENKTIREASIDMIHIPDEVLNAQSCIRLLVCDNKYYSREVEVSYEIFEEWLNKYKGIANKQQTD